MVRSSLIFLDTVQCHVEMSSLASVCNVFLLYPCKCMHVQIIFGWDEQWPKDIGSNMAEES